MNQVYSTIPDPKKIKRTNHFYIVGTIIFILLALVGAVYAFVPQFTFYGLIKPREIFSGTINMQGEWRGDPIKEKFLTDTVKAFTDSHPKIKVNIKYNTDFPGGRPGAIQATVNQIKSGGSDWDIVWLEPYNYQQVVDTLTYDSWIRNSIVNFESIPGFKESQKDFITLDPQYRNRMGGVITGPYIEGFYQPLFYNKVLADKMGLVIKDRGMTFADLAGYFRQIYNYNIENGTEIPALYESGLATGELGYGPSTWSIFQSLFRSEFQNLAEVENLTPSQAKLEAVRKVLKSLEELAQYKPLNKDYKNLNWYISRGYILDEKAVFSATGPTWMYSIWMATDKERTLNVVPAELPVYQPVNHYIGDYKPLFAVNRNSPLGVEAEQLLMSFCTPQVADRWVKDTKSPSGIKGSLIASESASNGNQFENFTNYITSKYNANIYDSATVDYILGDKYKGITDKFRQNLVAVIDGKITADEAYSRILTDMDLVP